MRKVYEVVLAESDVKEVFLIAAGSFAAAVELANENCSPLGNWEIEAITELGTLREKTA